MDKTIKFKILLGVSGIFIILIIVLALMPGFFLLNSDLSFNFRNFLIIPCLALIMVAFVFLASYCIAEIIDLKSKGGE